MIILADKTTHIVVMSLPNGSDTTGTNWCSRFNPALYDIITGVTLPAGYSNSWFTYIAGVWAIVPGKEYEVAAKIASATTTPSLVSGDITDGARYLSDGVTKCPLLVNVHTAYAATTYEIRYTKASGTDYTYIYSQTAGMVVIPDLSVSTIYYIAIRITSVWGLSDWTADVTHTTLAALTTSTASLVSDMGSDSKLTASEKQSLRIEWDSIYVEKVRLAAQIAVAPFNSITTEWTDYTTAFTALADYLNNAVTIETPATWVQGTTPPASIIDANLATTTAITTPVTFRAKFSVFYDKVQILSNKIAAVAATTAQWANIAGQTNAPASGATPGASICPNVMDWTNALGGGIAAVETVVDGKIENRVLRMWYEGDCFNNKFIPIDRTKSTFRVRFWARANDASSGTGYLYFCLHQFTDYAGTVGPNNGGRYPYKPSGQTHAAVGTAWKLFEYEWEVADWQAGVVCVRPSFLGHYQGTSGWFEIQGFECFDTTGVMNSVLIPAIASAATTSTWTGTTGKPADLAAFDAAAATALASAGNPAIVNHCNCTIAGGTVTKTGGGASSWDAAVFSRNAYDGGCTVSFVIDAVDAYIMVGLNTDPTTDASYSGLDYAIYCQGGASLGIFESSVSIIPSDVIYAAGDLFSVTYDGFSSVTYKKNGVVIRTVAAAAGIKFYLDSSFYTIGKSISKLRFTPYWWGVTAETIEAGVMTGSTIQTAKTGKRAAVYASNYSDTTLAGELHVWDDLGAGLEEIASIGLNQTGTDYSVGIFGTESVGNNKIGVIGRSYSNVGVYGLSTTSMGVYGRSYSSAGVIGISTTSTGVQGSSTSSTGVYGSSGSGMGIIGTSASNVAIYGFSTDNVGVQGNSTSNIGVYGNSSYGAAVKGVSVNNIGVHGTSTNDRGVYGQSTYSVGVTGSGGVASWDFSAAGGSANNYGTFTAGHEGLASLDFTAEQGDLICDISNYRKRGISSTINVVGLTIKANQKAIVGVLTTISNLIDYTPACLDDYSGAVMEILDSRFKRVIFNALGEGLINVCKDGGNIEIGDYICSSSRPGKGMKQDDDLLHNYTAAKAREAMTWGTDEDDIRQVACTYHAG